jgi:pantoate--beta-alanine ligase
MEPDLAKTIPDVRKAVQDARRRGLSIGFVPTMGALHEGHASLIRAARRETGFVVVSIFVNPTQFGPNEDFARYPRPRERDLALCRAEGADMVFVPETDTIYPLGIRTTVEVSDLSEIWEGASRPGHFRGVAMVVLKLFNIVAPDVAYFGQKDAQQVRVIQQLVRDVDLPIEVRVCPTVREADGLALSSRNRYLNSDQRRQAAVLFQALDEARAAIEGGERSAAVIQSLLAERIRKIPLATLDYVAVIDADTLQPLDPLCAKVLLAVAARFGSTRLIDNVEVQIP